MKKPTAAHSRFLMWVDEQLGERSREAVAAELDVSLATVFSWCSGRRTPLRRAARRIEVATSGWKDGPIKATEWKRKAVRA